MQSFLENSDLTVFLLEDYENNLLEIIEIVKKNKCRTCNILLRTPYDYFVSDLKQNNLMSNHFFYVDFLSRHYKVPEENKYCIFLDYPDINKIIDAVKYFIKAKGCKIILFDNISSLLRYHPRYVIQKLTNDLKSIISEDIKMIFLMPKKEELTVAESEMLLKDLKMFADSIKELS